MRFFVKSRRVLEYMTLLVLFFSPPPSEQVSHSPTQIFLLFRCCDDLPVKNLEIRVGNSTTYKVKIMYDRAGHTRQLSRQAGKLSHVLCGNSILTYCRRVNIFCILTCHKSLTVAFTLVKNRWWRFLNVVIVPGKIMKFVNVVIIQDCWRKCVWMSSLYPGQSDVQLDPGLVAPGRV